MNVFVILRVAQPAEMKSAIEANYPDNFHDLGSNAWLVATTGTAQTVSQTLGVTPEHDRPSIGAAIIARVEDYFGRAPRPTWDWIKSKLEDAGE